VVEIPEYLLGVVPDRVLAERYGVSRKVVASQRRWREIAPVHRAAKTYALDARVAAALDDAPASLVDVAAALGVPADRTLRRSLARVGVYSRASDVWRVR
jgi:hypothetical protein